MTAAMGVKRRAPRGQAAAHRAAAPQRSRGHGGAPLRQEACLSTSCGIRSRFCARVRPPLD
jgi:hypothetical protein